MDRIILHVDLDYFFAAVEILDNPKLKGLPIVVGANPKNGNGRGVVSTCSYEAREFGLHSGQAISRAYSLCPQAIFTPPHFKRYKEISNSVMEILKSYSDLFMQVSIDEAYFDITHITENFAVAEKIAHQIKDRVHESVGVTCSIGVAATKTHAKIGSDYNKPNGVTVITPDNYIELLSHLPITRIPGIGKKTKQYYINKGVNTLGDLFELSKTGMERKFGESGVWAWNAAHGKSSSRVHHIDEHFQRKSISKERTYYEDVADPAIIIASIEKLNTRIHKAMGKANLTYRTVSIKIRFSDFKTYTRAKSFYYPIFNEQKSMAVALDLMGEFIQHTPLKKKIRLVGLKFSNFGPKSHRQQKNLLGFIST